MDRFCSHLIQASDKTQNFYLIIIDMLVTVIKILSSFSLRSLKILELRRQRKLNCLSTSTPLDISTTKRVEGI